MLIRVEQISDDPIIVVTYGAPFAAERDIHAAQTQIADILRTHSGNFFRIDDLSQAEMDFSEFVVGIREATRDVPGSMTDERIHGILVGTSKIVKMAAESMKQEQYGATNTPMFTTLDAAISHARQALLAES